jgi:uroporphyrinogen-III decarboxylase
VNEETLKPQAPPFEPSPVFLARQKRIENAMRLEKPDRIPVAPAVVHYYPTRAKGISNRDAHYNIQQTLEVWKETTVKHDWDAAPPFGSIVPAKPLDILGVRQIKWPGGALPEHRPFQWVEGEYMMQDEYDEALADPNRFAIQKLWPRVAATLAPVTDISQMEPPLLLFLSNSYTLPGLIGEIVSQPSMVDMFEKALDLAKETERNKRIIADYSSSIRNLGYPLLLGGFTFCAFDWISDVLRRMRGVMLDMYRVPDKLLAAIDMFIPLTIQQTAVMAEQAGIKRAMIPLHRGSAGFMSDEQYARFYWPSLKALILGLIEADVAPVEIPSGTAAEEGSAAFRIG